MSVFISKATIQDSIDLTLLSKSLYRAYHDKLNFNRIPKVIVKAIEEKRIFVARENSKVIGYLLFELLKQSTEFPASIFISELYIKKQYRRQKIASRLVKKLFEYKYSADFNYFSVSHSPQKTWLSGFFKNLGFQPVGDTKAGCKKLTKKR